MMPEIAIPPAHERIRVCDGADHWPAAIQFGKDRVDDGIPGDRVCRRGFVYLQAETSLVAQVVERATDPPFIVAHRSVVAHLAAVLPFTEAAVVAPVQDLHLLAPDAVRTEDVKIRITGNLVERGQKLFRIAD